MPRKKNAPNALIAAATRVRMSDGKRGKADMGSTQEWHKEAWSYFDAIPEIKESVRYRGNQLGKLRLFPAVADPNDPDGDPIPVTDPASGVPAPIAAQAEAELNRLRSNLGGQGEILRMLDMNLEIPGECYLVGFAERDAVPDPRDATKMLTEAEPENWVIRSVSEVEVRGSGANVKYLVKRDETDKGTPLDPQRDEIIRIWTRHPQWSDKPDSAMRGLLADCRILQVLGQQLLAHTYRSLSAGLVLIPNELTFGPSDPTQAEDPTSDPLMESLDAVLGGPVEDPTNPSTVQPGLLRGPAEFLKPEYVRRLTFYDPEVMSGLEERIAARVTRIARGLNLPVEKVMGHQQTTFANAEQVDEDEFNDYLRPSADTAVDALTYAFLAPNLRALGVPDPWPDEIFIWYDASDLISQPDQEKHAPGAWDRGAINDAALRRSLGFSEDDAPTREELFERMLLKRGSMSQRLTLALYQMLGIPVPIDMEDVPAEEGPTPNGEAAAALLPLVASRPEPLVLNAASTPVPTPDYGRQLVELDRELRTRLMLEASAAMQRALDRAANVLRSRTNGTPMRATLDGAPRHRWFAQLGPALVADVLGEDDPLAGAWDALQERFFAWVAAAQAQARAIVAEVTGAALTAGALEDELAAAQAEDLAASWEWMAGAMTTVANERLWTPDPLAPPLGELDVDANTPPGLVRQAMARAGGTRGLFTSGAGDAWVALTDAGTRPAGGIGTGEAVRTALRDGGASVEAYRWVYGPAFRSRGFLPHQMLNGVVFRNFDDPVLANHSGWPPLPYYLPGDHNGCICDFEPIIIPATPGRLVASTWTNGDAPPPPPERREPTAQEGALVALMQTLAASLASPPPAPQVTVESPHVTVNPPAVHIEAPRAPNVRVDAPQITVNPPTVHVDAAPPAAVHVDAPQITVNPPAVNVEAPVVNVEAPPPPPPLGKRNRRVERDEEGNITRIVEE